jgi:hypothetical protein
VSPCRHAWRTLINHFDQRGDGRNVGFLVKLQDAQDEQESIDAFPQLMLIGYQDINKDELIVSENIIVAPTLFNLSNKLSGARANIIAVLDTGHNGLLATSIPFIELSTRLI